MAFIALVAGEIQTHCGHVRKKSRTVATIPAAVKRHLGKPGSRGFVDVGRNSVQTIPIDAARNHLVAKGVVNTINLRYLRASSEKIIKGMKTKDRKG